jgi:hypothetical protein
MTAGWRIYGKRLGPAIGENIVSKLAPINQIIDWEGDDYKLGQIPNLHSLIPYSLKARKPVFECTSKDGLTGAHIKRAADSASHFEEIVETLKLIASW